MTIGEKIVKLRKQAGLSQEAFSEKLGISRQAVSKWENDTAQPTNENLAQIARLFDVTISSLLDDEDIAMGSGSAFSPRADIPAPQQHTDKKEKSFKVGVFLQGVAIIILGITNIIQARSIGNLQSQLSSLNRRVVDYSLLQSKIDSLESRVYSLPYYATQTDENFTDYHYKVVNFDRNTNTATLSFSVVPKDYTRETQAQIVIKTASQDYSVPATLENNIFVATVDVQCGEDLSVYLYLTEDGKTRSFVLDYLADPASDLIMRVYDYEMGGDWRVGNGELKTTNGTVAYTVHYVINQDMSKSSYPVKATAELYYKDKLIYEQPCENLMNYDLVSEAKQLLADDTGTSVVDNEIIFWEYFDLNIKDESITSINEVNLIIRFVDNQGYEYTLEYPALGIAASRAEEIK